ncbi:hypothetical protein B0H12DRAFT_1086369 [Mycena haematopus]|nr:hypothetical protein B0H12DRAFT_1086369 [Mycena haematopus]
MIKTGSQNLFVTLQRTSNTLENGYALIAFDILSYLHLPEPMLAIYVHQLCENKDGPCDRAAKAESNIWRGYAGAPPNPPNSTRNINPEVQPLSRSCANCHRDPLEAPELRLKRCGRCKLTRGLLNGTINSC